MPGTSRMAAEADGQGHTERGAGEASREGEDDPLGIL